MIENNEKSGLMNFITVVLTPFILTGVFLFIYTILVDDSSLKGHHSNLNLLSFLIALPALFLIYYGLLGVIKKDHFWSHLYYSVCGLFLSYFVILHAIS